MPKLPFMKFYPADWWADTRSLSIGAKGCWIEIICLMWNSEPRGYWTGNYQEFARVTGSEWELAPGLIDELSKVATVTKRDNEVTLMCRRIINEDSHYKDHANRQSKYRELHKSDKKVTRKTLDVRRQTLDKDLTPTPTAGSVLSSEPYQRPDPSKDPTGAVVMAYKEGSGVTFDDRSWDKQFWGRWSASAKIILDNIGSYGDAVSFLQYQAREFQKKGISWTLRTVADRAVLWRSKERKKQHDTTSGARVYSDGSVPGADGNGDRLRKAVSAEEILATVRAGGKTENKDRSASGRLPDRINEPDLD